MTTELATRYAQAFAGALVLTLCATPLLRKLALRYDVVDQPAARKSHITPTPYLGGVGLIGAALIGLAFSPSLPWRVALVVLGGLAVGIVGLLDDKRTLNPAPRLVVQSLAALMALAAGVQGHITGVRIIDLALTFAWIVVLTNSFNLLDNMDGLSAGAAVVCGTGTFALAAMAGQYIVAAAAAGLVGGCIGFLAYNKRPASIFMGDAGALVLGYAMAILTIRIDPDLPRPHSYLIPLLLVWLPAFDTTFVVLTRIRSGRSVFQGGKDHLSHRLAARGLGPGRAVLVLLSLYAVVVVAAVARGRDALPAGLGTSTAVIVALAVLPQVRSVRLVHRPPARREVSVGS